MSTADFAFVLYLVRHEREEGRNEQSVFFFVVMFCFVFGFAINSKPATFNFHNKMTNYLPHCRVAYLCCDYVYQSFCIKCVDTMDL